MPRLPSWLPLWLACLASTIQAAPGGPAAATITYSEQPVRLVRDTAIYSAGRGVALQADDMLETGKGTIQLGAGRSTVAIGPLSRVYIRSGSELVLLEGWLKVKARAGAPVGVATSVLQLGGDDATAMLHAVSTTTEVFAESGALAVQELRAGRPGPRKSIPGEQFGVRSGAQPLRLAGRPPAAFLAAMPESFRDALVPIAAPAVPAAPRRERAAGFAELAGWLDGQPALRRQLQRRFAPPRPTRSAPAPFPTVQQ